MICQFITHPCGSMGFALADSGKLPHNKPICTASVNAFSQRRQPGEGAGFMALGTNQHVPWRLPRSRPSWQTARRLRAERMTATRAKPIAIAALSTTDGRVLSGLTRSDELSWPLRLRALAIWLKALARSSNAIVDAPRSQRTTPFKGTAINMRFAATGQRIRFEWDADG
jgi:hypothetical protein